MSAKRSSTIIHVPRRFTASEWGGTETVILEISRQQQRAGNAPVIFTSMALDKCPSESISGIPVRRFPYCYPFFNLSPAQRAAMDKKGGNLLSLSLFKSLLTEPDVRLFHAHVLKRLGGEVRTAARLRRKPYVVTLHGGVFDVPTAELNTMLEPIAGKFEWGRPFGALFGSRRVLDDADHVICVGQSERDKALKSLSHDRITYLPNGVDSSRFASGNGAAFRKSHGIPDDAFLILNISRIDAQKNQRLLLEAFAHLYKQQPRARLIFIGPETQPAYAKQLRAFIREQRLESAVQILPGIPNDRPELVDAYHASDVFVLPSMHEPFGIVVLEAWSASKPVIASRLGGLQSLISEGRTGMFIDPNVESAPTDLAARIEELICNPDHRQELGRAGRAEVLQQYDWERIQILCEDIYSAAEKHAAGKYGRK